MLDRLKNETQNEKYESENKKKIAQRYAQVILNIPG